LTFFSDVLSAQTEIPGSILITTLHLDLTQKRSLRTRSSIPYPENTKPGSTVAPDDINDSECGYVSDFKVNWNYKSPSAPIS